MLQAGLVDKEKVARGSLPPSAITSLDQLNGKVLSGPVNAKQFITAGTFVSAEDGLGSAFANQIKSDNLVAVTVTVDADRGVANQIAPGDHVNIAAKAADADGTSGAYTYILDHVKVLAVGSSVAAQQATVGGHVGRRHARRTDQLRRAHLRGDPGPGAADHQRQPGRQPDLPGAPGARPAGADRRSGQGRGEQQVAPWSRTPRRRAPSRRRRAFDVAVVEPDANLRTRLAIELAGAAQFETMEDLVQQLSPTRPVVAVFGPGSPARSASSTCTA